MCVSCSVRVCLIRKHYYSLLEKKCNDSCIDSSYSCGILSDPQNGAVAQQGESIGSVAKYTCNKGYVLEGDAERYCTDTGKWSEVARRCVPKGKMFAQNFFLYSLHKI